MNIKSTVAILSAILSSGVFAQTHWAMTYKIPGHSIQDLITDNGDGTCTRIMHTIYTLEYSKVKCEINNKSVSFTEELEYYECSQMREQFISESFKVLSATSKKLKVSFTGVDLKELEAGIAFLKAEIKKETDQKELKLLKGDLRKLNSHLKIVKYYPDAMMKVSTQEADKIKRAAQKNCAIRIK